MNEEQINIALSAWVNINQANKTPVGLILAITQYKELLLSLGVTEETLKMLVEY